MKTKSVMVRVKPRDELSGVVFRVKSMVDVGAGRQTIVLDHVNGAPVLFDHRRQESLCVPLRMGNLDFIYASGQSPCIQNVGMLLGALYKEARVERIVTDVLCPGDLLVFRQQKKTMKIKTVEALRIVKDVNLVLSKAGHAL